jgi:3-isopropylmalate dehydrogenase
MKTEFNIAVIAGDGIGPEITAQAVKALTAAGQVHGLKFRLTDYPLGGAHYLKTGQTLPESVFTELQGQDAILMGAIGHPEVKPGVLEKDILLALRFRLDLYVNLRPIKLYPGVETPLKGKGPQEIDLVIVRENTEGLYTGAGGRLFAGTDREVATQESINTYPSCRRALVYGFELARKTKPAKLTLVGKANVLTYASTLWQRAMADLAPGYPEVETDYNHVDAASMWLVTRPESYRVMVTDNLFGDILSDLGAAISGGLGVAAGGNIHPGRVSMFEPIGGSAPKYAGQDVVNPLAAILSTRLLLEHLGQPAAAARVEGAAAATILTMKGMSAGKMGAGTAEIGERVRRNILG